MKYPGRRFFYGGQQYAVMSPNVTSMSTHVLLIDTRSIRRPTFLQDLKPQNVAVEDDRLPTDDSITSSDCETEHNDVASDENNCAPITRCVFRVENFY